jgi:hypothetical protein
VHVDGTVAWEEHGCPPVCLLPGDAILSAFHRAGYQDGKGLLAGPRGNRGTWYGPDGETRVWIMCRQILRRAGS